MKNIPQDGTDPAVTKIPSSFFAHGHRPYAGIPIKNDIVKLKEPVVYPVHDVDDEPPLFALARTRDTPSVTAVAFVPVPFNTDADVDA